MFKRNKNNRLKRRPILRKLGEYRELLILLDEKKEVLEKSVKNLFPTANFTLLIPRHTKEINDTPPYISYHKSDFNLTGELKNEKLNELLSRTFDLVVDLSEETKINLALMKKINASFIIGGSTSNKAAWYDLQIEQSVCESADLEKIKNHLTLLSQHGN